MAKNIQPDNSVINIIGNGTKITGDIETNGDIRIDGNLKGNIITKGKIVIGETGNIEGTIECENSDISERISSFGYSAIGEKGGASILMSNKGYSELTLECNRCDSLSLLDPKYKHFLLMCIQHR